MHAQRPPRLRLPLEAMQSPPVPLPTPAEIGEDDGGKSHLQLRVLSTLGKELTADDLDVEYEGASPLSIALHCCPACVLCHSHQCHVASVSATVAYRISAIGMRVFVS